MITKTQARMIAQTLDMAADSFGNRTCNDFMLDATPENIEFVRGMIAASDYPDDEPCFSKNGTELYLVDYAVMRYCKRLIINACI